MAGDGYRNDNSIFWYGDGVFETGKYRDNTTIAQYASSMAGTLQTKIFFDASWNNGIYGSSSTVTPLSMSTKLILKY